MEDGGRINFLLMVEYGEKQVNNINFLLIGMISMVTKNHQTTRTNMMLLKVLLRPIPFRPKINLTN